MLEIFILCCHFFLVASGDNSNITSTVLLSTSTVSLIPSTQVQYNASRSTIKHPPATGLSHVDTSSIHSRGGNDNYEYSSGSTIVTNISPTPPSTQAENNANSTGLPNVNDSIVNQVPNVRLNHSSFEENSAFFSKNLVQRLRTWNDTLESDSKQCIKELNKLNITGGVTEESVEIKFPVFQTKDIDLDADFLSLDIIHPVLVRKKSDNDLVNVAYLSILELWPLLVLCFTCAALSGMILWFLVSRNVTIMQNKNEKMRTELEN